MTRRILGRSAGLLLLAAVLTGCAAAPAGEPRRMQAGDFRLLAGHWTGSAYVQQERPLAIEAVINENGSFYTAERRAGTTQVPGLMKIVDGGVIYESPHSEGKMTFHETSAQWVWKWQGQTRVGGRLVTNELTKAK